jgi:membrane fusion protein, multidrug efflux system
VPVPHARKRKWLWIVGVVAAAAMCIVGVPWVREMVNTISTDDAYVNGNVTYVAPRISGQVANVFVDENNVVRKGDLLIELDSEPYQVQANIAQAAVDAAKAELVAAKAQVNGLQAQVRSYQFNMQHAIEDVHNKSAELRATVAELETAKAKQARATADYNRAQSLQKANPGAISRQDIDKYQEAYRVTAAQINQALEHVHQIRVSLGLSATPLSGDDLAQVPDDLDQTFSGVREVQGKLMQAAAALGISGPFNKLPHEMEKDFFSRYPNQDIDQIFAKLLKDAPDIKRAETKLLQAERNLDQANLNLRYCKVYAEIDGAVTRKSVHPGNNVVAGQSIMALRSVKEIWVDANFKETQLAKLRIGQRVRCEVDMYGKHQEFEGRITGFTMGTGQTLSLLPPQNATGNFVKIVQRLPVRIDLTNYDSDKAPLFVGLSVEPRVYYKEPPTGPNAGKVLQPLASLSKTQNTLTTN